MKHETEAAIFPSSNVSSKRWWTYNKSHIHEWKSIFNLTSITVTKTVRFAKNEVSCLYKAIRRVETSKTRGNRVTCFRVSLAKKLPSTWQHDHGYTEDRECKEVCEIWKVTIPELQDQETALDYRDFEYYNSD